MSPASGGVPYLVLLFSIYLRAYKRARQPLLRPNAGRAMRTTSRLTLLLAGLALAAALQTFNRDIIGLAGGGAPNVSRVGFVWPATALAAPGAASGRRQPSRRFMSPALLTLQNPGIDVDIGSGVVRLKHVRQGSAAGRHAGTVARDAASSGPCLLHSDAHSLRESCRAAPENPSLLPLSCPQACRSKRGGRVPDTRSCTPVTEQCTGPS